MRELRVESDVGQETAAIVEVYNAKLDVDQKPLVGNQGVRFAVHEGPYLVRARWPDGQTSDHKVRVADDDVSLLLQPPPTSRSLIELGDPITAATYQAEPEAVPGELPYAGDEIPGVTPPQSSRGGLGQILDSVGNLLSIRGFLKGRRRPTYRLWVKEGQAWKKLPLADPERIDSGIQFEVQVGNGLHLFELSVGGISQFLSLPSARSVIAVRTYDSGDDVYSRADARTANHDVESLRGYIQRGELDIARKLALEVTAERYLQAKTSAPRIAALGAYFLLRVGELDRLHDWPDNLTNWREWLPDGPVIAAWQRLRSDNPDYEEILELLQEAVSRGLPVYTEGVRLLKDGLDLFASDEEEDWDVAADLAWVEKYAQAMVWDKSETTFYGEHPDKPNALISDHDFAQDWNKAVIWDK